jgi:hypothetical protein
MPTIVALPGVGLASRLIRRLYSGSAMEDRGARFFPRGWALVALLSVVFAYAFMGQTHTAGQATHLAAIKSLAEGTAILDETRFQVGDQPATDVSRFDGHWYSNKPPGLALISLPYYVLLDAAGYNPTPTRMYWALSLLGSVLPAALLLLLVRWVADRFEPEFGTVTAVSLGLGTLVLPYASTFFAHLLAAALLFGSFTLLWLTRCSTRVGLVALAGLLAGYAITTEYLSGLAAAVLGLYALATASTAGGRARGALRRGVVYAGGAVVGVIPLLLYQWWAFGSPFQLSYESGALEMGINEPSLPIGVQLLFSRWGLLVISPVLALGAVGAVLLFRRGVRAEALTLAAIPLAYFAFNTTYTTWPFGETAGPRYLIPSLAFLAVPLALSYRAWPLTTLALAVPSVCVAVIMTATKPLIAWDGHVLFRLTSSDGSAETIVDFVGITGWYDIVPFYAIVVFALFATVRATSLGLSRREVPMAGAALVGWAAIALAGREVLGGDWLSPDRAALFVLMVAVSVTVGVALISRGNLRARQFPPAGRAAGG